MKLVLDTWQSITAFWIGAIAFISVLGIIIITAMKTKMVNQIKVKGAKGEEAEIGGEPEPATPETLTPEEVTKLISESGAHECRRDKDFEQFSLVLEAVGDTFAGVAERILNPAAPPEVVSTPMAVLGVRMKDYKRHLDAQGYVGRVA
jgi:hypothetical protein